MSAQPQPKTDRSRAQKVAIGLLKVVLILIGAPIIGLLVVFALRSVSPTYRNETLPAPAAMRAPAAMPAYWGETGTERLLECGWTEEKQKEIDAEDAKKKDAQRAFAQKFIDQINAECDKPVSKMTLNEIEDCSKPGMRLFTRH